MNGSFMIGCGSSSQTSSSYEVKKNTIIENVGDTPTTFRYGFLPMWKSMGIPPKYFNIAIGLRFHEDSNAWIRNFRMQENAKVPAGVGDGCELYIANLIPALSFQNNTYGFINVQQNSIFWLWDWWVGPDRIASRNTYRANTKKMKFRCVFSWDASQGFVEFRVNNADVLTLNWAPIFY